MEKQVVQESECNILADYAISSILCFGNAKVNLAHILCVKLRSFFRVHSLGSGLGRVAYLEKRVLSLRCFKQVDRAQGGAKVRDVALKTAYNECRLYLVNSVSVK